jgi:hypothetical protein
MMHLPPTDHAAAELHAAAHLADARAGGDPFNPWTALAAQLRLVAAGLDPAPPAPVPHRDSAGAHVTAALDQLDTADAGTGVVDPAFWRRHVEHLQAETDRLETTASQPQGQQ